MQRAFNAEVSRLKEKIARLERGPEESLAVLKDKFTRLDYALKNNVHLNPSSIYYTPELVKPYEDEYYRIKSRIEELEK
jgi:hypothetical protein